MVVKVKKLKGNFRVDFSFGRGVASVVVGVASTSNLFFSGELDGEPVSGFLFRNGAGYAKSDALGKRDERSFIEAVASAAGYRWVSSK